MKKLLLILFSLYLLFSCNDGIKEKLSDGDTDIFIYETYEYTDLIPAITSVNDFLKELESVKNEADEKIEEALVSNNELDLEENSLLSELSSDSALTDTSSLTFEQFASENPFYAVLIPSLDQNNQPLQGPACGFAAVKDTAKVNSILAMSEVKNLFPRDIHFAWTVKPYDKEGKFVQLIALRLNKEMQGFNISNASDEISQYSNLPQVSISIGQDGTKEFEKFTTQNIGRSIALVIDGFVFSFPTVVFGISEGRFFITGNFSLNEVKELVKKIHSRKVYF